MVYKENKIRESENVNFSETVGKENIRKVMVVDDDPYILIALRELLESEDFEVLTADSGKDCIDELKKGFKGIIIMDIMMPFMNGIDTIRSMVKEDLIKDNIIMLLTAKNSSYQELGEIKKYVVDYIHKPFDPQTLITIINRHFTRSGK